MSEESWDEIKTQIQEQIKAFKFMEEHSVELYHKLNGTKLRNFNNCEYTPLQGANATGLWESAEIGFEMDNVVQQKMEKLKSD